MTCESQAAIVGPAYRMQSCHLILSGHLMSGAIDCPCFSASRHAEGRSLRVVASREPWMVTVYVAATAQRPIRATSRVLRTMCRLKPGGLLWRGRERQRQHRAHGSGAGTQGTDQRQGPGQGPCQGQIRARRFRVRVGSESGPFCYDTHGVALPVVGAHQALQAGEAGRVTLVSPEDLCSWSLDAGTAACLRVPHRCRSFRYGACINSEVTAYDSAEPYSRHARASVPERKARTS